MLKKIFKSYKTPDQKKENKREFLFGLLSGILLGLSYPPVPFPYLIFAGLIPYLIVIEKRKTLAEINRFTYFTAFIFNIITLYWVGSWTKDADTFLMVAGTVLMFFNPIVFLIPSTLYYFARKHFSLRTSLLLLPWFWLFYEYIYSITDFKFPWLSLSNSLPYFLSYIQVAEWIGSYGLTILIVYVNVFGYLSLKMWKKDVKLRWAEPVILLLLILLPIIYGQFKLNIEQEVKEKVKVGLIQPNLNPNKKWELGNLKKQLDLYLELSQKAINQNAEIIIWPETALPVYLLNKRYKTHKARIQNFVNKSNITLATGMPHAEFFYDLENAPVEAKPLKNSNGVYTSYNSILYFAPGRITEQYGKIKLVPFGEKVPLVDVFPVLGKWIKWNVGISSWNTGTDTLVYSSEINENLSVNIGGIICIESIYPDFVSSFVKKNADFIAVVTNDSWYGNSSGPYQHKEISVLRAVENRKPVVRAANGGISCIINSLGQTVASSEMFSQDVIVGDIELNDEKSFFSSYYLLLPIISILVAIFIILISIINKFRRRKLND